MSAPIQITCPDIDKALKEVEYIRRELKGLSKDSDISHNIQSELNFMLGSIDTIDDYFEELRTSNAKLRTWGDELEDTVTKQDKIIDDLEGKLSELEDEIKYIKQESSTQTKECSI